MEISPTPRPMMIGPPVAKAGNGFMTPVVRRLVCLMRNLFERSVVPLLTIFSLSETMSLGQPKLFYTGKESL